MTITSLSCGATDPTAILWQDESRWETTVEITVFDVSAGPFGDCTIYPYDVQLVCSPIGTWIMSLRATGTTTWYTATEITQLCDPLDYTGEWLVVDEANPGVTDTITVRIIAP